MPAGGWQGRSHGLKTQGASRTHSQGAQVRCSLCDEPLTVVHLIWRCRCFNDKDDPLPWNLQIENGTSLELWARGIIQLPRLKTDEGPDSFQCTVLLNEGWPLRLHHSQRVWLAVWPTCNEPLVRRYVVAVLVGTMVGQWLSDLCDAGAAHDDKGMDHRMLGHPQSLHSHSADQPAFQSGLAGLGEEGQG